MSPGLRTSCSCHSGGAPAAGEPASLRVALVGNPNVGKSALFNRLTARYVTVSNYPGTSVEIARGAARLGGRSAEVVDTPGLYALGAAAEEQAGVRRFLLDGGADVLVQVADATNLARMLGLTLQLMELERPLVMAVNMMDEAERAGVRLDLAALSAGLGIPVVPLVALTGQGVPQLEQAILEASGRPAPPAPVYGNGVGTAIRAVVAELTGSYPAGRTALAALVLQDEPDALERVRAAEPDRGARALARAREQVATFAAPPAYRIAVERQIAASAIAGSVVRDDAATRRSAWQRTASNLLTRPISGVPILFAVLYLGLYQFVGQFGGGTLVDWLEGWLFGQVLGPLFTASLSWIPWEPVRSLLVGDYGVLTLGLRYAVAIILPIVGTFFLFFSLLEDSGYLPRLALLVDRLFKRVGLSGRAVIPMVLGFACVTMATMVTRTLETRRERVLATLLLALAIPCSAQLGVILALMASQPLSLAIWSLSVLAIFLLVGLLGARLLPGPAPVFHMELPPLRRPRVGNVVTKTVARMQWYFLEVLPLFLLASVLIWAGKLTGAFQLVTGALEPLVAALGLPPQTAGIFLFGFFRRDYGAAGLFDLQQQGVLDSIQLAVAAVTLTLFIPCIAQFLMMLRERGVRTAVAMFALITPIAFGVGFLLNQLLRW